MCLKFTTKKDWAERNDCAKSLQQFPSYFSRLVLGYIFLIFFFYSSTGILRHLTVVRTSSLFGHVTKPAPAPVNIEKLQEEAQKVTRICV